MGKIRGITVTLLERKQAGTDDFNRPIYEETAVEVDNVLVAPASGTDIVGSIDLTGKKAVYTLGIPKGDTHNWEGQRVQFFGQTWQVFGPVTEGIEAMIPLGWNRKVMVERYE